MRVPRNRLKWSLWLGSSPVEYPQFRSLEQACCYCKKFKGDHYQGKYSPYYCEKDGYLTAVYTVGFLDE